MEVAKSSSQCKKYLKYSTSTAVDKQDTKLCFNLHYCQSKTQLWNIYLHCEWNIQILLTSHSIVGEPLTEFIDNNEEDAERVATYHFALMDYRKSSIVFSNGDSVQTIHIHLHINETYKYSSIAK